MIEYPDGFAELVVALNSSIVDEESLADTLRRVAFIACQSPIGADNAGVTLQREHSPALRRTTETPRFRLMSRNTRPTKDHVLPPSEPERRTGSNASPTTPHGGRSSSRPRRSWGS